MTNMMNRSFVVTLLVASLGSLYLSGCGRLAVADGSLNYREAKLLKPITLPAGQDVRQIYPLYDLPEKAEKNRLPLTNKKGNRYELPRPETQAQPEQTQSEAAPEQAQPASASSSQSLPGHILTETSQGVPILQVDADIPTTRQRLLAALKQANYLVKNDDARQAGAITIAHVGFSGERLLQYRNLGSVTTVVITDMNSQLASTEESRNILADIDARL